MDTTKEGIGKKSERGVNVPGLARERGDSNFFGRFEPNAR